MRIHSPSESEYKEPPVRKFSWHKINDIFHLGYKIAGTERINGVLVHVKSVGLTDSEIEVMIPREWKAEKYNIDGNRIENAVMFLGAESISSRLVKYRLRLNVGEYAVVVRSFRGKDQFMAVIENVNKQKGSVLIGKEHRAVYCE